jgi:hypothetical protein
MPGMNLRYRVPPEIVRAVLSFSGQDLPRRITRPYEIFVVLLVLFQLTSMTFSSRGEVLHTIALVTNIVLMSLLMFTDIGLRFMLRKASEEWGEMSLSLQENGLLVTQAGAQTLYSWASLRKIRAMPTTAGTQEAPTWLAITVNSAQRVVIPVPLAAFANEHEKQAFIAAINAGIVRQDMR